MNLKNDRYIIELKWNNSRELYYREKNSWIKESSRGNKFKATAEQVLNHILPVLSGVKDKVRCDVTYRDRDL